MTTETLTAVDMSCESYHSRDIDLGRRDARGRAIGLQVRARSQAYRWDGRTFVACPRWVEVTISVTRDGVAFGASQRGADIGVIDDGLNDRLEAEIDRRLRGARARYAKAPA